MLTRNARLGAGHGNIADNKGGLCTPQLSNSKRSSSIAIQAVLEAAAISKPQPKICPYTGCI